MPVASLQLRWSRRAPRRQPAMNRFYFGPGETAVVLPGTALRAKEERQLEIARLLLAPRSRHRKRPPCMGEMAV
jgi:hypothetical protein